MSARLEDESPAYEVKCKGQPVYDINVLVPFPLTIILPFSLSTQHTVTALNGLQTNAAVLEQIRRSGVRHPKEMSDMYHFLARTNMKVRTN